MRLLHEDELDFILDLKDKGVEDEIDFEASEAGLFMTPYMVQRTLDELSRIGLIEIKSVRIDYTKGHFLDGFLNSYTKLIKEGKIDEAKAFAIQGNFSALNDTLDEAKTIPEIWAKIDAVLDGKGYLIEADFDKDLSESIFVKLKVRPELSNYVDSYIEEFKKDKLKNPSSPNDAPEDRVRYFENEYYRFKKQREIFIELLQKKIDIQNPESLRIEYQKELPIKHINLIELILCLEKEGLIIESEFKYEDIKGNSLDDFGMSNKILLLSVNEDRILDQAQSTKKIKLNLSFTPQTGILMMVDQDNMEYKIKLQGQVQREVLRVVFKNTKDSYSEWNLSDISEILGGNEVDETAVKNAIYQFNKKVKLKIPEIDNLFELTKYSTKLNSKYVNKN